MKFNFTLHALQWHSEVSDFWRGGSEFLASEGLNYIVPWIFQLGRYIFLAIFPSFNLFLILMLVMSISIYVLFWSISLDPHCKFATTSSWSRLWSLRHEVVTCAHIVDELILEINYTSWTCGIFSTYVLQCINKDSSKEIHTLLNNHKDLCFISNVYIEMEFLSRAMYVHVNRIALIVDT